MHSSAVVQVINDIGQASAVFLLMAASLSGGMISFDLATLGTCHHLAIFGYSKIRVSVWDPKKYTKAIIALVSVILQHALRALMDTHRCMKPVTSGTKMPGVSRWVFMATSFVVNQIGKKNSVLELGSWRLADFTGVR